MWRKSKKGVNVPYSLIFLFNIGPGFCEILGKFVQCWENMCSVAAAFAAAGYHQKINPFKIKIPEKWCYSDDTALAFFVQYCLGSLGQHCTRFLSVQGCLKSITKLLNKIFSCAMLFGVSSVTLHRIFVSTILSQEYYEGFFHVQRCPELLGQHCTRLLPVQCCLSVVLRQHWRKFTPLNVVWRLLDN